jgi:transmembrane sensor
MFDYCKDMTIVSNDRLAEREALKRQAIEWLAHLSSGEMTQADAEALKRWCGASPAHAEAFASANRLWGLLGPATRNVAARARVQGDRPTLLPALLGRRAILSGAAAAATVAATGYLIVQPPLGLWPSVSELMAEYRTATGEQRQFTTAGGAAVEMNTQTSLNIGAATGGGDRIELIAGETVVMTGGTGSKPVVVVAADGRTNATAARFDVRLDGTSACVTCLGGTVDVEQRGAVATVREREQVTYGHGGLEQVISVDPAVVTSWRSGVLIFRSERLSRAIDEINRYRPGRIVLVNSSLGRRRIDASFRLDQIEHIVPQIESVFGVRARTLPGGLVLLG